MVISLKHPPFWGPYSTGDPKFTPAPRLRSVHQLPSHARGTRAEALRVYSRVYGLGLIGFRV